MEDALSAKSLPQPASPELKYYTYRRYDEFTLTLQSKLHLLPPMAPCRVMLSKGHNKGSQLSPYTVALLKKENDESINDKNDGRLIVQYPKGSTYHVRKKYIFPITQENKQIIVSPETSDYRRLCIVHTPKDHSFIEIGCDFAFTVGNVDCDQRLGIDKSPTSLAIAKSNFPDLALEEIDVLTESKERLMKVLERYQMTDQKKLIVAIDINGNRELEAVIECLQRVLDTWQPRLVIVKSRSLFALMLEHKI